MHTRPGRLVPLIASLGIVTVLLACSPTASTDGPGSSTRAPSTLPTDSAVSAAPSDAPQTPQTDTAWGRIWDDLPAGFPVFPTATIADDATAEALSGAFAIPDGDPAAIASWMQAALETATYSTEALSGPLEDGSLVLDSVGDVECRIQTTVAPMGGLTLMTIRYGAACPNR